MLPQWLKPCFIAISLFAAPWIVCAEPSPPNTYCYKLKKTVNLWAEPSNKSAKLGELPKNMLVEVQGQEHKYWKHLSLRTKNYLRMERIIQVPSENVIYFGAVEDDDELNFEFEDKNQCDKQFATPSAVTRLLEWGWRCQELLGIANYYAKDGKEEGGGLLIIENYVRLFFWVYEGDSPARVRIKGKIEEIEFDKNERTLIIIREDVFQVEKVNILGRKAFKIQNHWGLCWADPVESEDSD